MQEKNAISQQMSDIVKTAKKRVLTFIEQHYNYITISLHDTTLWKTERKALAISRKAV